jgi:hypothetical protein
MTKCKSWTLRPFAVFKDAGSNRIDLRRRIRKSIVVFVFTAIIYPGGYAQKPSSFEHFIQTVNNTPMAKRSSLVTQYLAKAEATPIIEGNENVHLVWFGTADTLKVEGELQRSWAIPQVMTRIDCGDEDFFYISYTLLADAVIEYRFIADGKSVLDKKNPRVVQGFDFSDRNFFTMPKFAASPYLKVRYGISKGVVNQWDVQDRSFAVFESTHLDIYAIWLFERCHIPCALRTRWSSNALRQTFPERGK